ncbi:hypothetical protein [Nonomuraea sp. NPDC049784]|uniref:hypothetical protein n=1 Tax=Nonomuraea sp. NPDC049784 TaxID=3154361 RepID=UPI0033FFCD85
MSPGIEISKAQVAQHAAMMRTHSEDYTAALQRLRERGYGCLSWGDDTGLFAAFHAEYGQCGVYGLEALAGVSQVINDTGDGLDAASRHIADAEALNIEEPAKLYGTNPV